MNIEEFVSNALIQIMKGVEKAQDNLKGSGIINPKVITDIDAFRKEGLMRYGNQQLLRVIDFDIAVTVSEEEKTKGGIGIVVGVLGLGSQGQSQSLNSSISRIKFQIPIGFPEVEIQKNKV